MVLEKDGKDEERTFTYSRESREYPAHSKMKER